MSSDQVGQPVHISISGTEHANVRPVGDPLFFTCPDCYHYTCFHCRQPHHPPLTCSEQEAFVQAQARPVDQASFDFIRNTSVQCPGCRAWVHKYQDCPHMTCSVCKTEFCYRCGMDYPRLGQDPGTHGTFCSGLGPGHTPYATNSSTSPVRAFGNRGSIPGQLARRIPPPVAVLLPGPVGSVFQHERIPVQRPHYQVTSRQPLRRPPRVRQEPPRSVGEACQRLWTHIQQADILGNVREEESTSPQRPRRPRPRVGDIYRHMRTANILGNSPDGAVRGAQGVPQTVQRILNHALNADILGNVPHTTALSCRDYFH